MFSSLAELSLSLNAFPRTFGIYTTDIKRIILQLICDYSGPQLKKICLYDFDFNETEKTKFKQYFEFFFTRGMECVYLNTN